MFKSASSLIWLGREREREVLKLSKSHMDNILKTVESMANTIQVFCEKAKNEEINRASNKVMENERKADKIKAKIFDKLSKGVFHPINREVIMKLVMAADDVAENARGAAEKITFLDPSELDEDLRDDLKTLSGLALKTVEILDTSYSTLLEYPEESLEKTGEVEKMEEKIDHFRAKNLLPKLIKWANRTRNPGTSIILLEVESNLEEVSDQAENVADAIREIAIGSV